MHFLLNHPELRQDVTETLKLRQHDAEESVRYFPTHTFGSAKVLLHTYEFLVFFFLLPSLGTRW